MTTQQHLSTMLQSEALAAIRKIDDEVELAKIADPTTGDFRSTVRAAAARRLRRLTLKPGRPFENPEVGKMRQRVFYMADAEWESVRRFGAAEGLTDSNAVRRLVRMGLVALAHVGR